MSLSRMHIPLMHFLWIYIYLDQGIENTQIDVKILHHKENCSLFKLLCLFLFIQNKLSLAWIWTLDPTVREYEADDIPMCHRASVNSTYRCSLPCLDSNCLTLVYQSNAYQLSCPDWIIFLLNIKSSNCIHAIVLCYSSMTSRDL